MPNESGKLKLTLWRDYEPHRPLLLQRSDEVSGHLITQDSSIQQEVLTWTMTEDPFASVIDEGDRANLHSHLFETFEASVNPSKRRISALCKFVDAVDIIVANGTLAWASREIAPDGDDTIPFRCNALLALKAYLQWLYACFIDQPGISITIR